MAADNKEVVSSHFLDTVKKKFSLKQNIPFPLNLNLVLSF